jgi:predicted metal-dependent RNase
MGKDSKKETSDKTIEFPEEKKVKQSKEKKREEPESDPSESETESDVEDSEDSSSVVSDEEEDDDTVSLSTTEILNGDPLYTILSQFFISKDGKNIADILEDISSKLKYLKVR